MRDMNYADKLVRANQITENLRKVQTQLDVIASSRLKQDKLRKNDSYPQLLKLTAWKCTGESGVDVGDVYGVGISDRVLLAQLFNAIEPILLSEKRALEAEMMSLLGTNS